MNHRHVALHIQQLTIDGLGVGDRAALAVAFERELTDLLEHRGVPAAWSGGTRVERVAAPSLEVNPASAVGDLGAQVARAVYGSFAR